MKTTECLRTFTPNPGQSAVVSVLGVSRLPKHPDRLIVATRSPVLRVMSTNGQVIQSYTLTSGDIVAYCPSPKGNYVYAVGSDSVLYAFSTETAKLEHVLKLHKKDVVGVTHHPHRNIFGSFSQDGTLKIWRP